MPSSKFGSKFFGEERYQQYVEELTADGTIDGEQLSPEERKEGFKKRNDKIGFQDFVEKVLDRKQSATVSKGPTALPGEDGGGALVKAPAAGISKFDPSKITPAAAAGGGILEEILKIVTSIRDTLIEKNEFDADQSSKQRQSAERAKRAKKEKGLESGIFKGLAKATEKVLAPVKGMFEKIFDFIKTVILGNIVMNILKWMGDPENKEKIDNLIRFFKDFWPAIVGAYLLFGTKFGGLIRTIGGWAVQILRFAVPKLLRFVSRNPKAAAALAVAGGVGMLGARILTGTEVGADEEEETTDEEPSIESAEPKQMVAGQEYDPDNPTDLQRKATDMSTQMGNPPPAKMSQGGRVPGSGNKDTVPAMLTPGEFVMSKGAVAKFGVDTMRSMNAAGGGTNLPERVNGITYAAGGGMVSGYEKEKSSSRHKQLMNERTIPSKNGGGSFGLPAGAPGLMGGGGGTNALTEQAKVRSIGAVIRDIFSIFRKKQIDPQTILGEVNESSGQNLAGATADRQLIKAQPGEYILPVDTVNYLGGPAKLDQLVAQTDSNSTPAKLGARSRKISQVGPPMPMQPQINLIPTPTGGSKGYGDSSGSALPNFDAGTGDANKAKLLGVVR